MMSEGWGWKGPGGLAAEDSVGGVSTHKHAPLLRSQFLRRGESPALETQLHKFGKRPDHGALSFAPGFQL